MRQLSSLRSLASFFMDARYILGQVCSLLVLFSFVSFRAVFSFCFSSVSVGMACRVVR